MISYDVTRRCQQPRWRSVSPSFRVPVTRKNIVADNKRNQILYRKRAASLRKVPAFTIQTEQQHTQPLTPAKTSKKPSSSLRVDAERFIELYNDRRLPLRLVDSASLGKPKEVEWQLDPNTLHVNDARELLKILASGLPIKKEPFSRLAVKSFQDLLTTVHGPQIVAQTLTVIIPHIRLGLDSRSVQKRFQILGLLEQIAQLNGCGRLLVPFYRQLLPPFRSTTKSRVSVDISETLADRYWARVANVLNILEKVGGPTAYINMKYVLPHYESSL